ncbi:MAG: DUF1704 domain-containing protein [Candidatus Gracilibacteria bacterium]|nr:DUF1704 domain-containing protein [Candidatus Gracilibacteria bacterium]
MSNFLDYTKSVNTIKSPFASPMGGILKYVQEEDNYLNTSFFKDKKIVTIEDINSNIQIFEEKLIKIKSLKKEINDSFLSDVEKKFLLNSLNSVGIKYIMFKSSVYLEAEKAGFELTDEQRVFYLRRVNKLQDMVYGPEISDIYSEKQAILDKLQRLINSKGDRLSDEEKDFISLKLGLVSGLKSNTKNGIKKNESTIEVDFSKIYISKQKVIELFEILVDLYGLSTVKISVENALNFSVLKIDDENESENGKYNYKIVLPESKLELTSLKRIFELFDHEIGVHAIRGYNGTKTLNTAGDGYVEVEEGFAKLSELLFDKKLESLKIEPGPNHIVGFFAENYDGDDTRKFIEIYYKLTKNPGISEEQIKKDSLNLLLRIKRFVSLKEKGANRKDVSYTRGQTQVVDYLQSASDVDRQNFLKDFYFAKLSFEDIGLVEEFRASLGIDETELKYPLWIGKILYKKLLGENITLAGLQEEDFRFGLIDESTFLNVDSEVEIIRKQILELL